MMISKNIFKVTIAPVLLMSCINIAHAKPECSSNCPAQAQVVTYTVNTYEDNQGFCGYDVEGNKQVCVDANVTQVDTTKITQTAPKANTMKVNAETTSDIKYTSKVSFGEGS